MRKFLRDNELKQMSWPEDFQFCKDLLYSSSSADVGSVGEVLKPQSDDSQQVVRLPPVKRVSIDSDDAEYLSNAYEEIYPDYSVMNVVRLSESFKKVQINNRIISSSTKTGVFVKCFDGKKKPAQIQRFISNEVILCKENKRKKVSHIMAEVLFFKTHPKLRWYPSSLEVWSTDFESLCFIPISTFAGQFINVKQKVKFDHGAETVQVIIPLVGKYS